MDQSKRKKRFIGLREIFFAILTSAIITAGRCIYNYNSTKWLYISFIEYLAIFAILFVPELIFYAVIGKCISGIKEHENITKAASPDAVPEGDTNEEVLSPGEEIDLLALKDDKTIEKESAAALKLPVIYRILPVITFVMVLASCTLALLSYFPGIHAYDSEWQTLQACNLLPLSNHHPVLHTLIWSVFIFFERIGLPHPFGLVLYCAFQILVVSFTCAYVVKREIKEGCRWYFGLLTLCFYVFYPAFAVFSVEMTKDVLFSCSVVILALNILKAGRGEKVNVVLFFINVTLACLLRNNFLPVAAVMTAVLLIIAKKEKMTKYFAASCAALVFSGVIMFVVYPVSGVQKSESREALSVPINQVAAVCVYRDPYLTIAEKFIVDNYMSSGMYNPRLADSVKFTFDSELYDSDRSAFWDLYMHLAGRFPDVFIDSFLTQNVQLWYPGARMTDRYAAREYIETDNVYVDSYKVERRTLLPAVLNYYENTITSIEKAGLLGGLPFSLSIPFYFLLIGFYAQGLIRRPSYTAVIVIMFALWGTYLLGPVAAFRYMYTFFLLIPVIMTPVFGGRTKTDKF